jgi:hypothetical protein
MSHKIQDRMIELKRQRTDALAVLRTGRSFEEAAQISGMSLDKIVRLWNENKDKRDGE